MANAAPWITVTPTSAAFTCVGSAETTMGVPPTPVTSAGLRLHAGRCATLDGAEPRASSRWSDKGSWQRLRELTWTAYSSADWRQATLYRYGPDVERIAYLLIGQTSSRALSITRPPAPYTSTR